MFWKNKTSQRMVRLWRKRIFLDYASITPIDQRVVEVMRRYETVANPSAIYTEGLEAKKVLEDAKKSIASVLSCRSEEIFFTSGGTESNNMAILGVFEACKTNKFKPHIIVTAIEHPSVLEVCKEVERRGGEVSIISVSEDGFVDPKNIEKALKKNTVLVSLMYANNEIGTIQPIKEISRILKEWRIKNNTIFPYFHTDACQAALYLSLEVNKLGVDLMTLDGIKMYGPRGIGMLYVKKDVNIKPLIFGGGQQNGLRSGTENVPAIAGFAEALSFASKMREGEGKRLSEIRDYGIKKILETFPNSNLNGSLDNRLPNNINICFPGFDAEFAVVSLDVAGISASYSSSCRTFAENSSSYVVEALAKSSLRDDRSNQHEADFRGKSNCASSSLRFSLGRESTKGDIDTLILALKKIIKHN